MGVIILLAFVAQTHAKEDSMDKMISHPRHNFHSATLDPTVDKLVNKLVNNVITLRHADLDKATLGKPGHVAISPHPKLSPSGLLNSFGAHLGSPNLRPTSNIVRPERQQLQQCFA